MWWTDRCFMCVWSSVNNGSRWNAKCGMTAHVHHQRLQVHSKFHQTLSGETNSKQTNKQTKLAGGARKSNEQDKSIIKNGLIKHAEHCLAAWVGTLPNKPFKKRRTYTHTRNDLFAKLVCVKMSTDKTSREVVWNFYKYKRFFSQFFSCFCAVLELLSTNNISPDFFLSLCCCDHSPQQH